MVQKAGKKIATTEDAKERQRQKIISTAIGLFGRQGYHQTTISQIAQQADMGRGTLYWYFSSKNEIMETIWQSFLDHMITQMENLVKRPVSIEEKINVLVHHWIKSGVEQPDLLRIMYAIIGQATGDGHHELLSSASVLYSKTISILEGMFNKAVEQKEIRKTDTHRLARLLISFVDGIMLQHLIVEPVDPDAMTEVVMNLFLQGLLPD